MPPRSNAELQVASTGLAADGNSKSPMGALAKVGVAVLVRVTRQCGTGQFGRHACGFRKSECIGDLQAGATANIALWNKGLDFLDDGFARQPVYGVPAEIPGPMTFSSVSSIRVIVSGLAATASLALRKRQGRACGAQARPSRKCRPLLHPGPYRS